jgi:hypothetical protein
MSELNFLSCWAKHRREAYADWIARSQGMNQRAAQAELLLTLLGEIKTQNAPITLRPAANGWICAQHSPFQGCSVDDPTIALLSSYTQWLEQGKPVSGDILGIRSTREAQS